MSEKSFDEELEDVLSEINKQEKKLTCMLESLDESEMALYKYAVYICRLNSECNVQKYLELYKDNFGGSYNRF